ncbi:MAG: carbohydrate kinase [Gammaproteobacteria bacterium SG8_11]|nr:MAG: carbohydrate kinase [Gammaproteobacteria bacterium SG8_11]
MSELPKNLYRAEQVRELDRIAIEELGIPGMKLMERAGSAAFNAIISHCPRAKRIAVVCGTGNNGGDGFVIARMADAAGFRVMVYLLGDPAKLKGDALMAYDRLEGSHVTRFQYDAHSFEMFDVVVDAMLGTGLQGDVKDQWLEAIENINRAKAQGTSVLAVDIPSGLHADTGRVLGAAVQADMTVTFIGMKQGLLTASGPDYCGRIVFNDLQVPSEAYVSITPAAERLVADDFVQVFGKRAPSTHKSECGHVLVVGGNLGMTGAVRMAAEAAARSGAGLVSVATRPEHALLVNVNQPELMCHGISQKSELMPLLDKADVVALGPGLGQDDWAQMLFDAVMHSSVPLILDADGLNLLAKQPRERANWVLTPHPGEAARLLNGSVHDVQSDRFYAAEQICQRYGAICVLKGCGTLVCGSGEVDMHVCDAGNPGMASGGMGDVLTGIIAALAAQYHDLSTAAAAGVYVHAAAGDLAAADGERGLLASDLFAHIRRLINPS